MFHISFICESNRFQNVLVVSHCEQVRVLEPHLPQQKSKQITFHNS